MHLKLYDAIDTDNTDKVRRLLKGRKRSIANFTDSYLRRAIRHDNLEIVQLLIQHGVNVHAVNKIDHDTALQMAVYRNSPEIVAELIRAKADVNAHSTGNRSPLALAASSGFIDIAELLLDAGARVNEGYTPLHRAAQRNDLEMAKLLLRHGADINILCDGNTPADVIGTTRYDYVFSVHVRDCLDTVVFFARNEAKFTLGNKCTRHTEVDLWIQVLRMRFAVATAQCITRVNTRSFIQMLPIEILREVCNRLIPARLLPFLT